MRTGRASELLRRRLIEQLSGMGEARGGSAIDSSIPLSSVLEVCFSLGAKVLRGLRWRFRLRGGHLLLVGRGVSIRNPAHIRTAGTLVVEDYAELQGLSSGGLRFGDRVTIGRFASVRPSGYYGREIGAGLEVGDFSSIGPYCFVGCAGPIRIGKRVMMGQGVYLLAEQHRFEDLDVPMQAQGTSRAGIFIGDDCWLGSGCRVLDGVTIGEGSIVAAGAVVTRSVPARSIVAGIPARVIRQREVDAREA